MNICFLSRDYPPKLIGGVGTYTYEMARALTELGHRVYVITETIANEGELMEDGICVTRIKPAELPIPFFLRGRLEMTVEYLEYSYAVFRALRRIVRKYKIDVVESCEARAEGLLYYLFYRTPPLVVKLHTPEGIVFMLDNIPRCFDTKVKDKLEEWWIFRSRKIVPVTKAIAELVSRYYRMDIEPVKPVYYPVDAEFYSPNGATEGSSFPKILYAGRLEVRKGVCYLIEAVPLVLKKFHHAHFYLVGKDAGVKDALQQKISQLGSASHITFVGHVNRGEMVSYYRTSDVCVFPSLWENFAFVALEAMACARAVVVSRTGGFLELIKDGVNGLFCNPHDPHDLAEKIIFLLANEAMRAQVGREARKTIVENYSPLEKAKKMVQIYEQLSV